MTTVSPRNRQVDQLISEFGRLIGLDALAFDDSNEITLEIGDVTITLEAKDDETGLLLKSGIIVPDSADAHTFVANLPTANLTAFSEGMGIVGLDMDRGSWMWLDRVSPAGATAAGLNEALMRAARNIGFWQEMVNDIASVPSSTAVSDLSDSETFIRI